MGRKQKEIEMEVISLKVSRETAERLRVESEVSYRKFGDLCRMILEGWLNELHKPKELRSK